MTAQNQDRLSVDALAAGLLAHLNGETPAAPAWFTQAVAQTPETLMVPCEGAALEVLTWGARGKPGLLLLHGNGAHAGWWRPLAPYFTDRYRVAALSFSGMGGSDWRPRYSSDLFAAEGMAAIEAAGLLESGAPPLVAAHSFGGFIALHMGARYGERLGGVVTLDSRLHPPDAPHEGPPQRTRPNRVYATFNEALGRFRLAPPQACENLFYVDLIARESLREAPMADGAGKGWTWKFDPFALSDFKFTDFRDNLLTAARCPVAQMWGDRSNLVTPDVADYMRRSAPPEAPAIVIPDADHHMLIDQPLATVAALNALFAAWPAASATVRRLLPGRGAV